MNIPIYTHPEDPDFNDPLNCIVPLSDKDLPDEEFDNKFYEDETPDDIRRLDESN